MQISSLLVVLILLAVALCVCAYYSTSQSSHSHQNDNAQALPRFTLFTSATGTDTVDSATFETWEQKLCWKYLHPDDCVLELGGNIGSVAICIQHKLADRTAHVVVEPQLDAAAALRRNAIQYGARFTLIQGTVGTQRMQVVGTGIGAHTVPAVDGAPAYSFQSLQDRMPKPFTALHADCEGCLLDLVQDYPDLPRQLRVAILELDRVPRSEYERVVFPWLERGGLRPEAGSDLHVVYLQGGQAPPATPP